MNELDQRKKIKNEETVSTINSEGMSYVNEGDNCVKY